MQLVQHLDQMVPGVFLEERHLVSSSELLIGVPVFVGFIHDDVSLPDPAKLTPFLKPQQFSLWPQFLKFQQDLAQQLSSNSELPLGFLPDAVRSFFETGGRLCYVYLIQTARPSIEVLKTGLEALEVLNTVDLVCAPGLMDWVLPPWSLDQKAIQNLQAVILDHCARMGDRFAILDSYPLLDDKHQPVKLPDTSQVQHLVDQQIDKVQAQKLFLSQPADYLDAQTPGDYGALYFPWLQIATIATQPRLVPPCGHIAGTYARCDRDRGVHHAPANDPLDAVLDVSLTISDQRQQQLNPEKQPGVNCIRAFRGRGIRAWGTRTLSQDPQWQYVNVRRLFLTLSRWIDLHLADAVFEPNDAVLWTRLERELGIYCEALRLRGALQGTTSQEAFYVRCNAETNPPALRELGQVRVELGMAPTVPGEFIRVCLIHGDSGVALAPA